MLHICFARRRRKLADQQTGEAMLTAFFEQTLTDTIPEQIVVSLGLEAHRCQSLADGNGLCAHIRRVAAVMQDAGGSLRSKFVKCLQELLMSMDDCLAGCAALKRLLLNTALSCDHRVDERGQFRGDIWGSSSPKDYLILGGPS